MAVSELNIQRQVADYIKWNYPSAIFHSDYGSGIKLTMAQAAMQKRLNGGRRSWPDIFIAEPRTIKSDDGNKYSYCGLFIELKRDDIRIFKKNGELVANEHIREQYDMLQALYRNGYKAEFACGFDEAKKLIDEYLGDMEDRFVTFDEARRIYAQAD